VFEIPLPRTKPHAGGLPRHYRNPVILALEWRVALEDGTYSCNADIARWLGLSRARVTQILNLLKLSPKAIRIVERLGDPLPYPNYYRTATS